ncbi:MAG: proline iminopeptidase-family hydrolase [Pseudomonadota bacterium]
MTETLEGVERQPDAMERVAVEGGDVMTYSFGSGDDVLFLANGGPGLPCDYMRDSHSHLAMDGLRVVTWDQLGTGRSDRPDDPSLWTIERYARELEAVRTGLGLGPIHLLGQSWGGWLAIEYALTFIDGVKSLVLSNTAGDLPHLVSELSRLRSALGPETVTMMLRREADGTIGHPEYKAAVALLDWRHVHRLDTIPPALQRSMDGMVFDIYNIMQGPNEFVYTGNLKDWNRIPDMHRIDRPALIIVGEHDELTPACAMKMHHALPNSRITVFPNTSHSTCFEDPAAYFNVLEDFLAEQNG